jgi:squalene-hopene/tetraprenyl-beta-curcumene cyclase
VTSTAAREVGQGAARSRAGEGDVGGGRGDGAVTSTLARQVGQGAAGSRAGEGDVGGGRGDGAVTSTAARQVSRGVVAGAAVERARRLLLACQDPEGSWPDRAAAEVTVAAERLLALDVLAIRTAQATSAAAAQIRSWQRADGSWAGGEPGAAADLSASVLGYLALLLAGDSPDAYHMAAAAGWIRDAGGIDGVGVTARVWLAIFGVTAWASVPVPSPEACYLSARASAEVGTFSPVTAVTLAVLGAVRPARPFPAGRTELQAIGAAPGQAAQPPPVVETEPGRARAAARQSALRRCGRWLADWQLQASQDGQGRPVWPLSLVALHALGYPRSHPAQAAGLVRLHGADGRPEGYEVFLPPVAHTALAIQALRAAGLPADDPALCTAGQWLLSQQVAVAATSPRSRGGPPPRGWSFCPDGCARPADTACVLIALGGMDLATGCGRPVADAARWLAATQSRDGSWASSAAVTGYCVRALASQDAQPTPVARAIRRGVIWLLQAQLPLGAWPGWRGCADLLATTVALAALRAAGVLPGKPSMTGAAGWLLAQQNADGGWHLGDVDGPGPPGGSDAAGTAHALAALLAVGGETVVGVDAAAGWLIRAQLPAGAWAGPGSAADRASRWRPATSGRLVAGVLLPLGALGRYAATAAQSCK